MLKHVGVLASGSDCPGLTATIGGVAKSASGVLHVEESRNPRLLALRPLRKIIMESFPAQ